MIKGSVHLQRKAGTVDTAFTHQLYDLMDDKGSDNSDDEVPETKNQYFEFSNSYHIMRSIKLIFFIQIIAILVDNPAIKLSIFFDICCKGFLHYSIHFYSRPFLDILYIIQYFWQHLVQLIQSQNLPSTPSGVEVSGRRLNTNPYGTYNDNSAPTSFSAVALDDHYWHTMKLYSHYFLGLLFTVMAVLFTIRFWEISDFSNRPEVTKWLHKYISDGWWRRGGLNVAISMLKGVMGCGLLILVVNSISRGFSSESTSTGIVVGSVFYIGMIIVCVIWALGYLGIKTTEAAFIRYVSQNVAYTSSIILKRAMKAKIDLGLMLMCAMFLPVTYTLLQSLLWFTDWNITHTPEFRKDINFNVPCYFMSFPPYRKDRLDPDFCSVEQYSSSLQIPRDNGFYDDRTILQCDSYLGITLYVFSSVLFVYMICGYFYMFYVLISQVTREFKSSKWINVLEKLIKIRDEEYADYLDRFSLWSRFEIAFRGEIYYQAMNIRIAFFWFIETFLKVLKSMIRSIYRPIRAVLKPIQFLLERAFIVSCLNIGEAPKSRKKRGSTSTKKSRPLLTRMSFFFSGKTDKMLETSEDTTANLPSSVTSKGNFISVDEDYGKSAKNSDRFDLEPWSISKRFNAQVSVLAKKINLIHMARETIKSLRHSMYRYFVRLPVVAYLIVNYNLFKHRLFADKENQGPVAHGVATLGGAHADWRKELTLPSKTRLIKKLRAHVINELRMSKIYFISEHELIISLFDYTIDSSGLFTLVMLYDYTRMYWFLVVLAELSLYAIVGAILKLYTTWQIRNYMFFCIDVLFGFLTYFVNPYTEEKDKWLEFCGRIMIALVSLGLVVYYETSKSLFVNSGQPIYAPWENFHYFTDLLSGKTNFSIGVIIDLFIVLYFYCYIIYILYAIGFFGMVDRTIQSITFSYHDHVLDFLVDKLDDRSFGMENIFSGLEFVQQWDDIIKLQRRYALLAWPDVRPSNLISFSNKIFEVKWASLFNLTLKNLRSSLGLTILHTTMFQADGEVSRWIMHTNPDLLSVADSQNDTPITIALKECAYYLMVFGEQNEGFLDDHTTYGDDDYATYYPEIDDVRDEVYQNGEFIEELGIVYLLTADDLIRIRDEGLYVEPKAIDLDKEERDLKEKQAKSKSGYNALKFGQKNNYEDIMLAKREKELEKLIKTQKRKRRLLDVKNQQEKASLIQRRFPEDEIYDNYETGQNSSWFVLRYNVPMENIFIDKYLYSRYIKFPNFHYDNHFHSRRAIKNDGGGMEGTKRRHKDGEDGADENEEDDDFIDLEKGGHHDDENEKPEEERYDDTTDIFDRFIEKDIQYVIPGHKAIHLVEQKNVIPLDEAKLQALAKEFPDWDRKKKSMSRRNSSFSGEERRESFHSGVGSVHSGAGSDTTAGGLMHILTGARAKEDNDRLASWKICKFAEILMSKEIAGACKSMRWDINDFKAFNKLASVNQGKIAQHLAMVCHLNPPEGFVRISDWSVGNLPDVFDERPEGELNLVVKGIITLVSAVENAAGAAAETVAKVGEFVTVSVDVKSLKGRSKRSRSVRRSSKSISVRAGTDGDSKSHDRESITEGMLSDRVVQYLAETLVCSTPHLNLDDCELSYNGRRGWRAITRALRRKYCTFILPSVFMAPKPVVLLSLVLTRNELDCGDCVFVADILMNQPELKYLDLSFNRIGARGMNRICKALRDHKCIEFFIAHDNIMGPGCGRDIGLFLKATKTLKLFNLSRNRLGEIVRFPTMLSREKLVSAAHDICTGLRYNKSLEILDISYNHLGTTLCDSLPFSVIRHPKLNSLNIAGNDLGPIHGSQLVFQLSGMPYGPKLAKEKEEFIKFIQSRQTERLKLEQALSKVLEGNEPATNEIAEPESIYGKESFVHADSNILADVGTDSIVKGGALDEASTVNGSYVNSPVGKSGSKLLSSSKIEGPKKTKEEEESENALKILSSAMDENANHIRKPALNLTSLDISHNQLGAFSGYAIGAAIEHMKGLTHLDISGNSLGTVGADRITDALELCYDIKPREFIKLVLYDIEEKKYDPKFTRKPKKRKKRFTNLLSLNMARNGIGPKIIGSLMLCMKSFKCTIIDLNVADNPIGSVLGETQGNTVDSAVLVRDGFQNNLSLINVNFNNCFFDITNLITIFGGLAAHETIQKLSLENVYLDEPCCLQLSNVIQHCEHLNYLNLSNCRMGANGGVMVSQKVRLFIDRIYYLNLNYNFVGPISAIYLSEGLRQGNCAMKTLLLKSNDLMEEGGLAIAKSLLGNSSVTDIDLSYNHFTEEVAFFLADATRGLYEDGVKVRSSMIKKFVVNDNPAIGYYGSKLMVKSLANDIIEHFEISNIGAGPSTAEIISRALRDPFIAWKNINLSRNKMSRHGLNQIFWGLKHNKRLRIINVSENEAGTLFCSNEDTLLSHGISVPVMINFNVCLKELDLSYNTLVSEAGINIIDAIIDNHTIKKLSLRGNLLDDNIAIILPDLLKVNNVLEELDLGHNRLGFACAYAVAEALESNRSLKKLVLDYNSFGGSGTATLQSFMKSLMMNYSLQYLNLSGNKLGPDWGKAFADIIVRNNTLIQFSLKDNRLDSDSGLALYNAYKNSPYLVELALTSDEIGVVLYEKFKAVFNAKRASIHPELLEQETSLSDSQSALLATYKN